MKLLVNDDGTTIPAKDWIKIEYRLGWGDISLGDHYYFIGLKTNQEISQLLMKYDETPQLTFYFYKDILYMNFEGEQYHYTIGMFKPEFEHLKQQIARENRILFIMLDQNDEPEHYYVYNIS